MKKVEVGDIVKFYDCKSAFRDRDFSGKDPKYYPLGEVVRVYDYTSHGVTDKVCDIKVGNSISKTHFVDSLCIGRLQSKL